MKDRDLTSAETKQAKMFREDWREKCCLQCKYYITKDEGREWLCELSKCSDEAVMNFTKSHGCQGIREYLETGVFPERARNVKEEENEEKCCGECCWFYGEDTDGWGFCACQKGDILDIMHCRDFCTDTTNVNEESYVSRKEMRHHMAVLLQMSRYEKDPLRHLSPWYEEKDRAIKFAYRYIKVFGKL